MTNYLDNLPPEVASEIAMNQIMGAAEAAAFCNYSLPHWRRMYRSGAAPPPVRLSARKVGWRIGTLVEFNAKKEAA